MDSNGVTATAATMSFLVDAMASGVVADGVSKETLDEL